MTTNTKPRPIFLLAALLIGSALIVILWRVRPTNDASTSDGRANPITGINDAIPMNPPVGQSDDNSENTQQSQTSSPAGNQERSSAVTASTDAVNKASAHEVIENLTADYLERNVRAIFFYGLVADQNGQPVEGATVTFSKTYRSTPAPAVSDDSGRFELSGASGRYLTVRVNKPGYLATSSSQQTFDYSPESGNFQPDISNPITFGLRTRGLGADLITSQYGASSQFSIKPPADGSPIVVDLINRKTGEFGQMEVIKTTPTRDGDRGAKEWRLRLSISDGGFVAHDDEFPYQAPETGYQPTLDFHFRPRAENWTDTVKGHYYFTFGNPPRYGRVRIESGTYRGVTLEYAINPDGSRYLEPKTTE